ncbi:hypothetical protein KBB48_00535 [Candidatus Shapirobacteria bacterium]|nr:hypothetical protein [Candidatus Shapirobacteria bacterium]
MAKKFLIISFFVLVLRLLSLNQSLWLDEAISANVVKNYSYSDIITKFSPSDFHPPFFYLTLKAWTSIFGESEVALRLPSVTFSLITIYLVFRFFGFGPSLLLALNPLYLYYSQEARMYSLVTLLVFCAFLTFKSKKLLLYYLFTFLSLSTFYGSIFFFAAISLYWLSKKNYKNFFLYSFAPFISLLILSPLLWSQYQTSKSMLVSVKNWSSVLGPANLKNLILILIKFTIGRISFYPKWAYYLIAFLVTLPLWFKVVINSFRERSISFIFWVTLIVGLVFSLFTPMFQYFRFLYLIPFLCLILKKNLLFTFCFLAFSLLYLINPVFHRENWRDLAATLPSEIYMIISASDPVIYYRPDIKIHNLAKDIPSTPEITILPYVSEIHGVDYTSRLKDLGYFKKQSFSYVGPLTKEIWQKSKE